MKGVQCYELFGGIALKIHTFSFFIFISLPFTDCALNEATMNECNFVSSFLHLDLNDDGVEYDIHCLNLGGDRRYSR